MQRYAGQDAQQRTSQVSVSGVLLQKAVMAVTVVPASYQGLCGLGWQHLVRSRLPIVAQHNDQHRIAARHAARRSVGEISGILKLLQLVSTEDDWL